MKQIRLCHKTLNKYTELRANARIWFMRTSSSAEEMPFCPHRKFFAEFSVWEKCKESYCNNHRRKEKRKLFKTPSRFEVFGKRFKWTVWVAQKLPELSFRGAEPLSMMKCHCHAYKSFWLGEFISKVAKYNSMKVRYCKILYCNLDEFNSHGSYIFYSPYF